MIRKQVFLLSITSGILLSLPWLFPGLGWVLLFAFLPLLIAGNILHRQSELRNSSFFYSVFFVFLIWNVGSCWWIGYVSVIGMILIVILNALFMASVWWAANMIRKQFGQIPGYFCLLVFWITFEFLQYHWTIQWPWLNLGNGLANSVKMIQWYEFTGVLGGSMWILTSNILLAQIAEHLFEKSYLKAARQLGLTLIIIGFPLILSTQLYNKVTDSGSVIEVSVLQPNIDPYAQKFSGMSVSGQIGILDSLALSIKSESTDLIVAPETCLPLFWEDSMINQTETGKFLTEILDQYPTVSFMAGAITKRKFGNGESVSGTARLSTDGKYSYDSFNSALLFNQTYGYQISHKKILVSGVEKFPFQKYFAFLERFTLDLGGTNGSLAEAKDATLFDLENGIKIGPVICFESAFGEHTADLVRRGAQLLVVITNDGWWRDSPGCWQHFGYSRIRAIETRRDIVRSANTGISGFINSRGEVPKKSEIGTCVIMSSSVRLNDRITFYTRYGDFIGWICSFSSGLILINFLFRKLKVIDLKWF